MKLLEHQAKKVLASYHLPVPGHELVTSVDEVDAALKRLGNISTGVVKAQVYTGGRGKAGGVRLFKSAAEAQQIVLEMLGMRLITHQTGDEGVVVGSVIIEEASDIERELYVAIAIDRVHSSPLIMLSEEGGVDIESVAENMPEKLLRLRPKISVDIPEGMLKEAADFLSLQADAHSEFQAVLEKLYEVFKKTDASLLEINPLIVSKSNHISILDCKFDIDENALYRQKHLGLDSHSDKDDAEIEAAKYNMSYISLHGNIGCMVNGAGLAMATMDTITYYGGIPANFLDVGGSASAAAVTKAFELISADANVQCILVNIFGGIMKCDIIAEGIIAAVKKVGLNVPLVVRLEGTNVEEGKALIAQSKLHLIAAESLADAAQKAVASLKK